jgi:hypothetical protein
MNGLSAPRIVKPALIGGAAAGLLSGLPVIQCLCCLWVVAGAALAVSLAAKDAPGPLRPGEGALVGAAAGIAAAVVHSLVNIPFQAVHLAFFRRIFEHLAEYGQPMPEGWRDLLSRTEAGSFNVAGFLVGLLIFAAAFAAFGAIGGIIGAALFGKKPSSAAAPPPTAVPPSLSQP